MEKIFAMLSSVMSSIGDVGQDKATLATSFDALGPERSARITHVSADAAVWIASVVAGKAPKAIRCADPFHVVKWATEALDEVRGTAWSEARKAAENEARRGRGRPPADAPARPDSVRAAGTKNCRYALWKNPENLTENQQAKLAWIVQTDPTLTEAEAVGATAIIDAGATVSTWKTLCINERGY